MRRVLVKQVLISHRKKNNLTLHLEAASCWSGWVESFSGTGATKPFSLVKQKSLAHANYSS